MEKVGVSLGRPRKPFIQKSTNIFLNLPNEQIIQLLDALEIEYEVPELAWDSRILVQLVDEIENILEDFLEKNKK